MLAETGSVTLQVPEWGAWLLVVVGVNYILFGSRWPRVFDVLSMTLIGCGAGLVASEFIPLVQIASVMIGGFALGTLAAFFRRVAHGVLAAIVLGLVLSSLAALVVPEGEGFASYVTRAEYGIEIDGPDLSADPVLAAALVGLLTGAAVAALRFGFSRAFITSAQGAGLIVLSMARVIHLHRGLGGGDVVEQYPLTLAASWLCLTVIGVVTQRTLWQRGREGEGPSGEATVEEALAEELVRGIVPPRGPSKP